MPSNTTLPAFHFMVSFEGLPADNGSDNQFFSVSGLSAGITNADMRDLPIATTKKTRTVSLQRAVRSGKNSPLRKWLLRSLDKEGMIVKEMLVTVLDEEHQPAMVFSLGNVRAAGWELGELNAGKSELLLETILLHYDSLKLK